MIYLLNTELQFSEGTGRPSRTVKCISLINKKNIVFTVTLFDKCCPLHLPSNLKHSVFFCKISGGTLVL